MRILLQAVYGVLKEAEHRSTFYIPYWDLPGAKCAPCSTSPLFRSTQSALAN